MLKTARRVILILACISSFTGCEDADTQSDMPDQADARGLIDRTVGDMNVPPDYGPNCVAVMADDGSWLPSCLEVDQMLAPDQSVDAAIEVVIHSPMNGDTFAQGEIIPFSATVGADGVPLEFVALELSSFTDNEQALVFNRTNGLVGADLVGLTPGRQVLTLTARAAPDIEVSVSVEVNIDCSFRTDFSLPLDEMIWSKRGSASLVEPGGWLEMTNNTANRRGAIFLTGKTINPGDLDVSFRISAGADGCSAPEVDCVDGLGRPRELADGFAVSFWNVGVPQLDQLWDLIGYSGNGAMYSESSLARVGLESGSGPEGFTIEFDLYYNYCPNNGFFDPTSEPHVEIWQNGAYARGGCDFTDFSAEEGLTWSAFPAMTDNYWHDVNVRIIGQQVTVTIDGMVVLDTTLPEFRFKGGILSFSGGSGAVAAYQRFDDLVINSSCAP